MAKIGLDTKEYMNTFRAVMLPDLVKRIEENFPKVDLTNISTETIQMVFRAVTFSALEDYFTFALERVIEDNNNKLYEDLVKRGVIKEELEEKEEEAEQAEEKKKEAEE